MAEIYVPELQKTCSLSSMTMQRYGHTQNGFLSCGGFDGKSWSHETCELYVPGVGWRLEPYDLMEWKWGHTSWTLKNGSVLLLGSPLDGINTELVTPGVGTVPGFYLNNRSRYYIKQIRYGVINLQAIAKLKQAKAIAITGFGCIPLPTTHQLTLLRLFLSPL